MYGGVFGQARIMEVCILVLPDACGGVACVFGRGGSVFVKKALFLCVMCVGFVFFSYICTLSVWLDLDRYWFRYCCWGA